MPHARVDDTVSNRTRLLPSNQRFVVSHDRS